MREVSFVELEEETKSSVDNICYMYYVMFLPDKRCFTTTWAFLVFYLPMWAGYVRDKINKYTATTVQYTSASR